MSEMQRAAAQVKAHEERFAGYRKPTDVTIPKFKAIQEKTKELADLIFMECPESLEKSKALTDLQNVRMWANAAIAIHTPPDLDQERNK